MAVISAKPPRCPTRYNQAIADRSPEAQAWFAWQLSMRALAMGRVETAIRRGRGSFALFRQLGFKTFAQACGTHLAMALALRGRGEEAADVLNTVGSLGDWPWHPSDLLEAKAWTAVAGGSVPRAHTLLVEAATLAERRGDRVGEASALHALARLGFAREVLSRLDALTGIMEGQLIQAFAAHARGLAAHDGDALEVVSDVFHDMGANLLAAEAASLAAVARRQHGDPRRAVAAERKAADLAAQCEGAVTPALQPVGIQARLTAAELRVALLAAAGRSNPEIADEIHLSVRTVANHLQHVYEKLGISRRSDLASALQSPGATAAGI